MASRQCFHVMFSQHAVGATAGSGPAPRSSVTHQLDDEFPPSGRKGKWRFGRACLALFAADIRQPTAEFRGLVDGWSWERRSCMLDLTMLFGAFVELYPRQLMQADSKPLLASLPTGGEPQRASPMKSWAAARYPTRAWQLVGISICPFWCQRHNELILIPPLLWSAVPERAAPSSSFTRSQHAQPCTVKSFPDGHPRLASAPKDEYETVDNATTEFISARNPTTFAMVATTALALVIWQQPRVPGGWNRAESRTP